MFTEFTVKDFRCFSELRLERLERINLIAGKNNTRKTALLEAIDLHNHPNGCQLALEMNKLRGVSQPGKAFGEVLSWLFRDKQGEAGLELSSTDDNSIKRSLTLSLLDATTARERLSEDEKRGVLQLHPDLWAIGSPTLLMR